jgi:hypothetical protein
MLEFLSVVNFPFIYLNKSHQPFLFFVKIFMVSACMIANLQPAYTTPQVTESTLLTLSLLLFTTRVME